MKEPRKIKIANLPTPLQRTEFEGKRFYVKRDDLTEISLSGNKIRKLEYLLYDAKAKGADYIFTCGGEQSNFARATVIGAAMQGIKTRLFLWGKENTKPTGNLFLDKFAGAEIEFLTKSEYDHVDDLMAKRAKEFKRKRKKVYVFREGGSSPLGIWGYVNFAKELAENNQLKGIKGILTAAGSGGTAAGLLIGSAVYDIPLKIFGVTVLHSKKFLMNRIEKLVEEFSREFNFKQKIDLSNLEILEGYSKEGYKNITDNKVKLIKKFFISTGILLDPAYTGKAFYAYKENFLTGKTTNVMFLHSGGIFGIFGKTKRFLEV
jgi:D-cysteine desulfhydrase